MADDQHTFHDVQARAFLRPDGLRTTDLLDLPGTGPPTASKGLKPGVASSPPAVDTLYQEGIIRAWCRFNMGTDAILDSFNISSITDGALGVDTVVFDRDMADVNYGAWATAGDSTVNNAIVGSRLVGSCDVFCRDVGATPTAVDDTRMSLLILGAQ